MERPWPPEMHDATPATARVWGTYVAGGLLRTSIRPTLNFLLLHRASVLISNTQPMLNLLPLLHASI
jgi:hypothetical protein